MFRLIRCLTVKQCLAGQLPALVGAACVAEAFYKFHSFTLECGAFLATWCALDALVQGATRLMTRYLIPSPAQQSSHAAG